MMRAIFALFAVGAAIAGGPTFAQVADATGPVGPPLNAQLLSIEGQAPIACSIRLVSLNSGSAGSLNSAGAGSAVVRLGSPDFVNPQTAVPVGGQLQLSVPITCNGAHTLQVRSTNGRLTLEGGAAGGNGFRNTVDYGLTTNWGGLNQSFNTAAANTLQIPVNQATSGDALVTISIPAGGQPLVAGVYSDLIVVEVTVGS